MTGLTPPHDWSALRWPEIADGDPARWIAVLPLAATEQHGPHLPVGTDVFIAEAYLAEVKRRLPADLPATFLPVQPVGISTEHMAYPGTLTLPPEVALAAWMALGGAIARAGLRKLVIVTSHGGNSAAMTMVAQELRARHGMLVVTTAWGRFGAPDGLLPDDELRHGVHGGAVETSIMLARYPQHVRTHAIANNKPASVAMAAEFRRLSTARPAPMAWQAEDLHPSGVAGNATLATGDAGERLLAHGAAAFCDLLTDVARFDLTALTNKPQTG